MAGEPPLILRDPRVASALAALPQRFSAQDAETAWTDLFGDAARDAFGVLAREGVIVPDDGRHAEHDAWAADGWWEASLFHHATRDFPFLAMSEPGAFADDDERMRRYSAEAPPPSRVVDDGNRRRTPLTALPDDDWDGFVAALGPAQRRGAEGLSVLLDVCCGVRRQIEFAEQGAFDSKAVPSGGARHPTEAFVATFGVEGTEPGVYHYAPREHALALVREGDTADRWREATGDLFDRSPAPPLAVVAFASLWERAMWRYRDDRSARAPLIDLGHVLQVFRDVSAVLGFEVRSYQKVRDREVAHLCDVEPRSLTPLYVAALS
jgi:SagB-type dehydrogenase family enzyme